MLISFSDHSRYQIKDRKLSKRAAQAAVRDPDTVFEQSDGRHSRCKENYLVSLVNHTPL